MSFDRQKLKTYPTKPGIYIMKDVISRILYIGKATNLKNRLKQYFFGQDSRATVSILISQIESIDIIIVTNNKEALILENTLIKKHQPKYNILLKDDKTYVSLMLTNHKWPLLKLVRLKKTPKDKNLYFGPYTNVKAARQTLDLIFSIFQIRQCSDSELKSRKRACILYDIKRCLAPCVDKCTKKEYDNQTAQVVKFLNGKDKIILKNLKQKMQIASKNLEFEKADQIYQQTKQIEHIMQTQFVDILSVKNTDSIGFYREKESLLIVKLIFLQGRLIASEHFSFFEIFSKENDILESFLLQHYKTKQIPSQILLPLELKNKTILEEILSKIAHKKISLLFPQKGKKKDLIKLANQNARTLYNYEKKASSLREKQLLGLQEILLLHNFPNKIECFDTSNIAGTDPVAALVVFINGQKDKAQTKLFKVKEENRSDVAAMREVLYRHLSKQKEKDFTDLLILDGAKAQLNVALKILDQLNIASIDVIALAKQSSRHDFGLTQEKVYLPHIKDPIFINPKSPLLFLLQNIRDEAHRVAISFHKKRRAKRTITSSLDTIKGIGPVKRKALLKTFKSIENLKKASKEDLKQIKSLSSKDIQTLIKFLKIKS